MRFLNSAVLLAFLMGVSSAWALETMKICKGTSFFKKEKLQREGQPFLLSIDRPRRVLIAAPSYGQYAPVEVAVNLDSQGVSASISGPGQQVTKTQTEIILPMNMSDTHWRAKTSNVLLSISSSMNSTQCSPLKPDFGPLKTSIIF